jgi:uncharacterized BrkB/YihY/UPF0761 family membrane protein
MNKKIKKESFIESMDFLGIVFGYILMLIIFLFILVSWIIDNFSNNNFLDIPIELIISILFVLSPPVFFWIYLYKKNEKS